MCKVIDDYIEIGMEQGIEQGMVSSIKAIMQNLNLSLEDALKAVGIPENKKNRYMELLNV